MGYWLVRLQLVMLWVKLRLPVGTSSEVTQQAIVQALTKNDYRYSFSEANYADTPHVWVLVIHGEHSSYGGEVSLSQDAKKLTIRLYTRP